MARRRALQQQRRAQAAPPLPLRPDGQAGEEVGREPSGVVLRGGGEGVHPRGGEGGHCFFSSPVSRFAGRRP